MKKEFRKTRRPNGDGRFIILPMVIGISPKEC